MRKPVLAIVVLFLIFSETALSQDGLGSSEARRIFEKAGELYQEKEYNSAAAEYQKIVDSGYKSAEVLFNLGNCRYKLQDYPAAILNYERAKKLSPGDDEIEFNIKLANLQIVDKIKPVPEVFYVRWYKSLTGAASSSGWGRLTLILLWTGLLFAAGFVFLRDSRYKRICFFAGVVVMILSLFSAIIGFDVKKNELERNEAIVMTESVFVKSSPDTDSKNLFMLHSGTKVKIEDKIDDWYKIEIADGNDGWMKADEVEKI